MPLWSVWITQANACRQQNYEQWNAPSSLITTLPKAASNENNELTVPTPFSLLFSSPSIFYIDSLIKFALTFSTHVTFLALLPFSRSSICISMARKQQWHSNQNWKTLVGKQGFYANSATFRENFVINLICLKLWSFWSIKLHHLHI